MDGNDEDCGEFRAYDGVGGTDEVDDPVLVSGAEYGFEGGTLYLLKFSFKLAGPVLGEYEFGIVCDGGIKSSLPVILQVMRCVRFLLSMFHHCS